MQQSITTADALELFLLDCQAQQFTTDTLRFYRDRLSLFTRWLGESDVTLLAAIQPTHIRLYFVALQERNLSSAYVHSFGRAIRAWLRYCVRDGLLESSPFERVKMPRLAKQILPALTDDEVKAALAACDNPRDRALLTFLLDCGCRASELAELNVGDVNLKTGQVTITQGKMQKDRHTYIGAQARKLVRLYLMSRGNPGDNEPLFVSLRTGDRITYSGIAQFFRRLQEQTGNDGLSAHACRRTFAINMLRNGCDIFVLSRMMGHEDLTILRQYLDIVQQDLADAHGKHGPIDHM